MKGTEDLVKIEKSRIIIYIYIAIASIMLYLFNNIFVFCTVEIGLIIILSCSLKFDIKHPLTLFSFVFVLYQIAFPIINYNDIVIFESVKINENYFLYNWIAFTSFIIFFGNLKLIKYKEEKIYSNININIVKIIYSIFILISIASSFYLINKGYSSKYEIAKANSILIIIGNMSYTILIPLTLYFFVDEKLKLKNKIIVGIISLLVMFLGMFTFGERSFVFNYIIIFLIFYFTLNKIKIKKLLLIGIGLIIFVSISTTLKMIWVKGFTKQSNTNFILNFLNSDFSAAGFNFNYLLNNKFDTLNGKSYIYDFFSPIDDIVSGVKEFSSPKWYKSTYWSTRRTGLGFSIIAEGYLNFKVIGILIEMFIFARMIKFAYKKSNKNTYFYIIYLNFISLCMYACRQDLANVISPLFKYNILLALFIYGISPKKKGIGNKLNE